MIAMSSSHPVSSSPAGTTEKNTVDDDDETVKAINRKMDQGAEI